MSRETKQTKNIMAKFHFSYDITTDSDINILDVVHFLCGEEKCKNIKHPVKSTFIFESDKNIKILSEAINNKYPENFYYVLSEIQDSIAYSQNPEITMDYSKPCETYNLNSKINQK